MGREMQAARWRCVRRCAVAVGVIAVSLSLPPSGRAALSWSGPIARDPAGSGPALTTVACTGAGSCTALHSGGGAVTFDPGAPAPSTPVGVDSATPLALTCPAANTCVSVDTAGNEVTFDPAAAAAASSHSIDPGQILVAVTCLSPSNCVAVDTAGSEVSFDPGARTGAAPHSIDGGQVLTGVSCFAPPSATQSDCAAVDGSGREVTFNSENGSVSVQSTIDFSGGAALTALTCVSATKCLAFDAKGTQIQFAPNGGGIVSRGLDPAAGIVAVACPSAAQCTVADAAGNEITFAPGGTGTAVAVDPSKSISDLACAGPGRCVAVNAKGQAIGFDPTAGAVSPPALVDATGSYSAVACSLATQCTAADTSGDAVTFDPQTGAVVASGPVDAGAVLVYAVACPSAGQCTMVDLNGNEVTFDPRAPGSHSSRQLVKSHPLLALACPSPTQCTAVSDDRAEITFNPQAPAGATYALLGTPAGTSITGVACPSAAQCTAVDGIGEEVTFDPHAPGQPAAHPVLAGAAVAVACPGPLECVAVDAAGNRATFNPLAPAPGSTSQIDSSQPSDLACVTGTYCVTVDAAGRAVEFDPYGTGATGSRAVGSGGSVTGLACGAAGACVAVDSTGHAFLGSGGLPVLPAAVQPPSVKGALIDGDTLTGAVGGWSGTPTSYASQWQRCAAGGGACRAIAGATTLAYKLTSADIGHAIRLSEQGANQSGYGPAALSAPTRAVSGRPAPPRLSRPRLSAAGGRLQLRFGVTSARFGPRLRALTVVLPAGLVVSGSLTRSSVGVSWRGRPVPFSVHGAGRSLRLTLRRTVGSVVVVLRSPQLVARAGLMRRLRRGQATKLTLTVALTAHGDHGLRATAVWTAA